MAARTDDKADICGGVMPIRLATTVRKKNRPIAI
jgi:hypothetical protein